MEILVTNDDGWGAAGLKVLIEEIAPLGHLTVVVPDGARSGMSNAVSATQPMYLSKADPTTMGLKAEGIDCYTTNGTPSDCVKLAINVLFEEDERKIDLLVSGINHGSNAAINQIYSGTMGAVFVGAEHCIPAIGFSIDDMSQEPDFTYMREMIGKVTRHLLDEGFRPGLCFNINAPKGTIAGLRWTRQCRSHWVKEMREIQDEQGRKCYALSGYMVNDEPEATDTDQYALEHGYLSIQPCKVDMTDYGAL